MKRSVARRSMAIALAGCPLVVVPTIRADAPASLERHHAIDAALEAWMPVPESRPAAWELTSLVSRPPLPASLATEPLELATGLVQIECDDDSVISHTGDGSQTANGGGADCDGTSTGTLSCCEECQVQYEECKNGCIPGPSCAVCERRFDRCLKECPGGCP